MATHYAKIVVIGPFNAGKTQFINTASEIATVQTERCVNDQTRRRLGRNWRTRLLEAV
jgi:signal recognition particle receptor subunit beta